MSQPMAAMAVRADSYETMAAKTMESNEPSDWYEAWLVQQYADHDLKRHNDSDHQELNKRFCDESTVDFYADHRCNAHEDEEEWREITEDERQMMNISNQLINFNMNFEPMPEWPDVFPPPTRDVPCLKPKPNDPEFPPETGKIVHGYHLDTLLTASKRSAIFIGRKEKCDKEVVIKIGIEMGFHRLQSEHNNYGKLRTCKSVIKILDYIWWRVYREDHSSIRWGLVVMEKCGPSLTDLMKASPVRVNKPIENLFEIAIKMIDAIEQFHDKGFIHRALKPDHFILENDHNPNCLKVIGLSGAKSFLKVGTSQHVDEQSDRKLPKGDPNFHSIGHHNGYRRSRRDDMESLGYCLVYVAKGTLPWMVTNKDLSSANVIRKIGARMMDTTLEEMCQDLPNNFIRYFEVIEKYQFTDKPDYEALRNCFKAAMI